MKNKKLLVTVPNNVICTSEEFNNSNVGSNEILVKSIFTHLSAGTELACLAGLEDWFSIPGTPGYTSIAKIEQTGNEITHLKPGDLVYTYGPHAEYFKLEYGDRWHGVCVKLPENINLEHAAFTHMAGIAMTSIRNSNIELGDFVLITGLGAIGNLAAQLAQIQGATVIATDIDESRINRAKDAGIRYVFNSKEAELKKEIETLTDGVLVDTYIDASGASMVIENSLDFVKLNGEVILLGSPRSPYETNLTKTLQRFHLLPHCLTLKGALEFSYPTHQNDFNKHSIERNAQIILNLIKNDDLKIAPICSHLIKPEKAQQAYEGLRNKPEEYIGVVFDWTK